MSKTYRCSDGRFVTNDTIKSRRKRTYHELYSENIQPICAGCGEVYAQGSAHLIPQSVCKNEGMAELCWSHENIVPACYDCNSLLESYKNEDIKKLLCYDLLLDVTRKYLPSRYYAIIYGNNTDIHAEENSSVLTPPQASAETVQQTESL